MYLTHEEYGVFGGVADEETFNRLEYRARKFVDQVTCCRIRDETPVRECVRRLMFELVGVMQNQAEAERRQSAGIASESNDGLSVSYTSGQGSEASEEVCLKLAAQYLCGETDADGVCLLYRGWGR